MRTPLACAPSLGHGGRTARVESLSYAIVGGYRDRLFILLGAVGWCC